MDHRVCMFHVAGGCKKGDACEFQHLKPSAVGLRDEDYVGFRPAYVHTAKADKEKAQQSSLPSDQDGPPRVAPALAGCSPDMPLPPDEHDSDFTSDPPMILPLVKQQSVQRGHWFFPIRMTGTQRSEIQLSGLIPDSDGTSCHKGAATEEYRNVPECPSECG